MPTKPPFGAQIDYTHPQGNPAAMFLMNEGSGSRAGDSGGNSSHGNIAGAIWDGSPKGGALYLDGVNDYINIGLMKDLGSHIGTKAATFVIILNTTNDSSRMCVYGTFSNGSNTAINITINQHQNGSFVKGNILMFTRGDGDRWLKTWVAADTGIYDGLEHMLVVVVDYINSTGSVYIDGIEYNVTLITNGAPTSLSDFQYPMSLGSRNLRGVQDIFFSGYLGGGSIYKHVFSSVEIRQLFHNPYAMFPSPDISRYFVPPVAELLAFERHSPRGMNRGAPWGVV